MGEADNEKSGEPVTFRVTNAVWLNVPLVPMIVSEGPPTGVLVDVETVKVEVAPAAIDAGLNEAVAPVGSPVALKFMTPLNPLSAPALAV
jgi:hypothetical protein